MSEPWGTMSGRGTISDDQWGDVVTAGLDAHMSATGTGALARRLLAPGEGVEWGGRCYESDLRALAEGARVDVAEHGRGAPRAHRTAGRGRPRGPGRQGAGREAGAGVRRTRGARGPRRPRRARPGDSVPAGGRRGHRSARRRDRRGLLRRAASVHRRGGAVLGDAVPPPAERSGRTRAARRRGRTGMGARAHHPCHFPVRMADLPRPGIPRLLRRPGPPRGRGPGGPPRDLGGVVLGGAQRCAGRFPGHAGRRIGRARPALLDAPVRAGEGHHRSPHAVRRGV